MTEEKKDFPKIDRKAKAEPIEETPEVVESETEVELSFNEKMLALGQLMRDNASDILKFDSTDQFDNQYVDTHQYKRMLGMMCDQVGLSFGITTLKHDLTIERDNKGVMIFIINGFYEVQFGDTDDTSHTWFRTAGLGVSRGSAYASTIAETNALRNFIMNNFLLMGNDREDDIKAIGSVSKYLTEEKKAEKREELLEKTKSAAEYATVQFGNIIYNKIQEVLAKEIPAPTREKFEKFVANKFDGEGNPIKLEGSTDLWVVKKKAANAVLSDLDELA